MLIFLHLAEDQKGLPHSNFINVTSFQTEIVRWTTYFTQALCAYKEGVIGEKNNYAPGWIF